MTHIRGCLLYPRTMRSHPHAVVFEQVHERAPSPQRAFVPLCQDTIVA